MKDIGLNSPALSIILKLKQYIGKKYVCSGGTWTCALQRLQHPLPVLEGTCPQEREGETGVQEALLRGGLAGHWQWAGRGRRDLHLQPLPQGPEYTTEDKLQPAGPQQ